MKASENTTKILYLRDAAMFLTQKPEKCTHVATIPENNMSTNPRNRHEPRLLARTILEGALLRAGQCTAVLLRVCLCVCTHLFIYLQILLSR